MQIELDLDAYDHPEEVLLKRCQEFFALESKDDFRLSRIYPLMTMEGNWHCGPFYEIKGDMDISEVTRGMKAINRKVNVQGLIHITEGWTYSKGIDVALYKAIKDLPDENKTRVVESFYREAPPSSDPGRRTVVLGTTVYLPDGVAGCYGAEVDELVVRRGDAIGGRVVNLLRESLGMT